MSLKQEIETWVSALSHYDRNEYDASLDCFDAIADTSKILFNCGVIHATLGEHGKAVDRYQRAVQLDQYLAVAYFQQGVSNFLMGDFEEALANFNDTLLYLRGNNNIDYEQLGLKFKLHSCEVLFNRGLCYIYLQQQDAGMQDLLFASKEKAVSDHDVIDEAIRERAEGYTVFSIPVGTVYRPNAAKVKNLRSRDYLGKARLVAQHEYSTSNLDARRQIVTANLAIDDRPEQKLSYGALHLVKPGLSSRSRQQSEPPMNRIMAPPTPPPEIERPSSAASKRKSVASAQSVPLSFTQVKTVGFSKPHRLDLGPAAFEQARPDRHAISSERAKGETANIRIVRSSSEQRRPRDRRPWDGREEHPSRRFDVNEDIECDIRLYKPEDQMQQLRPKHQRTMSNNKVPSWERPVSIEEEVDGDEESHALSGASTTSSPKDVRPSAPSFDIIQNAKQQYEPHSIAPSNSQYTPEMQKIRVKVYADDTRYMMVDADVAFSKLADQVRKKFGFQRNFKMKMRDEEGDMVTMGDQEDLDMVVSACRKAAAAEGADMGKIDIWIQEV